MELRNSETSLKIKLSVFSVPQVHGHAIFTTVYSLNLIIHMKGNWFRLNVLYIRQQKSIGKIDHSNRYRMLLTVIFYLNLTILDQNHKTDNRPFFLFLNTIKIYFNETLLTTDLKSIFMTKVLQWSCIHFSYIVPVLTRKNHPIFGIERMIHHHFGRECI